MPALPARQASPDVGRDGGPGTANMHGDDGDFMLTS